jgi:hypothetical protein
MHLFGLSETAFSLDELTAKAGLGIEEAPDKKPKGNPLLKTRKDFNPARKTGMSITKGIDMDADAN